MSEPVTESASPTAEAPPLTSFAIVTFFLLLPLVALWVSASPHTAWVPCLGLTGMMFYYKPRTVVWLRWLVGPLAWVGVIATGLSIGVAVGSWVNDVPSKADLAEREQLMEDAQLQIAMLYAMVGTAGGQIGHGREAAVLANEALTELEQEAPEDSRVAQLRQQWVVFGPAAIAVGDVVGMYQGLADIYATPNEAALTQAMARAVAAVTSLTPPPDYGNLKEQTLAELKRLEGLKDEYIRLRRVMITNCGSPPRGEGSFKRYMQRVANDPDSIEIQSCTTPNGTEDTCWMVTCVVRGKNAFGALVLSEQSFLVRHGEVMSLD